MGAFYHQESTDQNRLDPDQDQEHSVIKDWKSRTGRSPELAVDPLLSCDFTLWFGCETTGRTMMAPSRFMPTEAHKIPDGKQVE